MKPIKKAFARILRKDQTDCEKKMWSLLRDRKFCGLKFRRQHVVEGFVVDFFCRDYRLALEIDGGIHSRRKDYDDARNQILLSEGVTLIRIPNSAIKKSPASVLRIIEKHIKKFSLSPWERDVKSKLWHLIKQGEGLF
jgi:very-short-patch-repair endonuclease